MHTGYVFSGRACRSGTALFGVTAVVCEAQATVAKEITASSQPTLKVADDGQEAASGE